MAETHGRSAEGNRPAARNILLALGWYYPEIHRGVARFARDHGWHLTADLDNPVPRHWNGDGVVTLLGARRGLWNRLKNQKVPIVDLAESRPNITLPRLTMDNAAIGRLAAEHFLDRGYVHFAFTNRHELGVSRRRREAFSLALASAGRPCHVLSWQRERGRKLDTRDNRHRWLMTRLQMLPKPLAVFAARDIEAVEVIEACFSVGLVVPDQVAVLGVDNTETVCDCLRVPLSSIDDNLEQVGYQGAALLQGLLQGQMAPVSPVYVPPAGIVVRRSTDWLAVGHPQVVKALRFLDDHAEHPIGTNDVARHVGMSRSGLEKAFREHYVRAPMEQLRQIRLARAKSMLLHTNLRVVAIAEQCGFQTAHNLCRVFRHGVGVTPKQFRSCNGSLGALG
jgi:LacI family transcriptional regulator